MTEGPRSAAINCTNLISVKVRQERVHLHMMGPTSVASLVSL